MKTHLHLLAILALGAFLNTSAAESEITSSKPYTHVAMVGKVASDSDIEWLEVEGAEVLYHRGHFVLTLMPSNFLGRPSASGQTRKRAAAERGITFESFAPEGRRANPSLDVALPAANISDVHYGNSLPQPATGLGVVVGLCDIGFDATHPAFTDPATGELRIAKVVEYKEGYGVRREITDPAKIREWGCDTTSGTHATHVAGIMAASDIGNPYVGAAPDAEIVATTSMLSDAGILAGVEDVVAYAKEQGKRCVVNLSVANLLGPHDGTSYFCQYLDLIAEEEDAIIVIAAGNSGNSTCEIDHTLTEANQLLPFRLANTAWDNRHMSGETQAWSSTNSPLSFQPVVFDSDSGETVFEFPEVDFTQKSATGNGSYALSKNSSADWTEYFDGALVVNGAVSPENNRYYLKFTYNFTATADATSGSWARYNLGFRLKGEPGNRVLVFADGSHTFLRRLEDGPSPSSSWSINDLATGHNTICVGMWNSRVSYPSYPDGTHNDTQPLGDVNVYSSYATLLDGRVLPHTTAPGYSIVAPASHFYVDADESRQSQMAVKYNDRDEDYWYMGGSGTSMASPLVAGAIACWLELMPDLTPEGAKEFVVDSNSHDYTDPENPRHGQGRFDCFAALNKTMVATGARMLATGSGEQRIAVMGDRVEVLTPQATTLEVFSANGGTTRKLEVGPGRTVIPTSDLKNAGAVSILRVGSATAKLL